MQRDVTTHADNACAPSCELVNMKSGALVGHSFVRSLKDHLSVPHSKTEFSEDFKISHHCYLHLHGISGGRISDNIFVKEILDFAQATGNSHQ